MMDSNAVTRIHAAIARIEAAIERREQDELALLARHEALRRDVAQAVAGIDALLPRDAA
jgi:2-methylisocitrate lyase-like PEP mutase family enzyme